MRVTIIPVDRIVCINGAAVSDVDMSSLPAEVHAVQWYGTRGEVEFVDQFEAAHKIAGDPDPKHPGQFFAIDVPARVVKPANQIITDLTPYQTVIALAQEHLLAGL